MFPLIDWFPDSVLAQAVYQVLFGSSEEKDKWWSVEVSQEQLQQVTAITQVGSTGLTSLEGIQALPNLKQLAFTGNESGRLRSLEPVKACSLLETLFLPQHFLKDLGPLSVLPNLRIVNLSFNQLNSLTPLAGKSLTYVNVVGNQIMDFRPLQESPASKTGDIFGWAQMILAPTSDMWLEEQRCYAPTGQFLPLDWRIIKKDKSGELYPCRQKYGDTFWPISIFSEGRVAQSEEKLVIFPSSNQAMIKVYDAQGKLIADEWVLRPGKTFGSKKWNSDRMVDAINLASEHKGRVLLPTGHWTFLTTIEVLPFVTLEGSEETVLYREISDYSDEFFSTIEGVYFYDTFLRLQEETTLRQIVLEGGQVNHNQFFEFHNAISCCGKYKEDSGKQIPEHRDYLHHIVIEDVTIQHFAGTGILMDLVKWITIRGTQPITPKTPGLMRLEHIAAGGIVLYSVENVYIEQIFVSDIFYDKSLTDRYIYGIVSSMRQLKYLEPGLAYARKYPMSKNVHIQNNVLVNISCGRGIDSRGTQGFLVVNNCLLNVQQPVVIGGQDYSKVTEPDSGYYFPSRDVRVTDNRINQAEDLMAWRVSLSAKSQVGIAIEGTSKRFSQYSEKVYMYTNCVVARNAIDQVAPDKSQKYAGISLKLVGGETEGAGQIFENFLGMEAPHSIEYAGIGLIQLNRKLCIENNQFGVIKTFPDQTKTGAAIVYYDKSNTCFLRNNHFIPDTTNNERLTPLVEDQVYGTYSENVCGDWISNRWVTGEYVDQAFLANYALFQHATFGEDQVSVVSGPGIWQLDAYEGTLEEVRSGKGLLLEQRQAVHGGISDWFFPESTKGIVFVGRNEHANVKYRHPVAYLAVNQVLLPPDALYIQPYDRSDNNVIGCASTGITKVNFYDALGTYFNNRPVIEGSFFGGSKGKRKLRLVGVDRFDQRRAEQWVNGTDKEGMLTVDPYDLSDSYVTGTCGEAVQCIVFYDSEEKILLEGAPENKYFSFPVEGRIRSQLAQITACSYSMNKEGACVLRMQVDVAISDHTVTWSLPAYDLSVKKWSGMVCGEIQRISCYSVEIGKQLSGAHTPEGRFSLDLWGRIENREQKILMIGYDEKDVARIQEPLVLHDSAYDFPSPIVLDLSQKTLTVPIKFSEGCCFLVNEQTHEKREGTIKEKQEVTFNVDKFCTTKQEVVTIQAFDGKNNLRTKVSLDLTDEAYQLILQPYTFQQRYLKGTCGEKTGGIQVFVNGVKKNQLTTSDRNFILELGSRVMNPEDLVEVVSLELTQSNPLTGIVRDRIIISILS